MEAGPTQRTAAAKGPASGRLADGLGMNALLEMIHRLFAGGVPTIPGYGSSHHSPTIDIRWRAVSFRKYRVYEIPQKRIIWFHRRGIS